MHKTDDETKRSDDTKPKASGKKGAAEAKRKRDRDKAISGKGLKNSICCANELCVHPGGTTKLSADEYFKNHQVQNCDQCNHLAHSELGDS